MKTIIAAHDRNRVIGRNGDIPWIGRMPADMKRFKELTTNNAILMGRKTYESIGKPLPDRRNVVMTRSTEYDATGIEVVSSLEEAYELVDEDEHLYIIGGSEIYRLAMPTVDRLELTLIDSEFDGDVYFPEINEDEWDLVEEERHRADSRNQYFYAFRTYERKED